MTSAEETRRLQLTIDRVPGLIGYWDRNGHNVTANAAFVDYFAMTPAQVRGRHLREVLGEELYTLNLPFIDGVLAGVEQLFDRTLVDRHGVRRHLQVSYVPDIVDGEVRGFVAQTVDVTLRVEAEHARGEASRLFQIDVVSKLRDTILEASGQSDLDATLQRVIAVGMELTGAGYGAVGVHGQDGRMISFLQAGMDADTVRLIGEFPSGKCLLGAQIAAGQVLLVDDVGSASFPTHHPSMRAVLGVPITIRGTVFGSLYFGDPQTGDTFTESDESAVRTLAAAAAVGVDHAQLFQRERSAVKFMSASRQMTTELLSDADSGVRPLQLIVDCARELTNAEQAIVLVPDGNEPSDGPIQTLVVTAAVGLHAADLLGQRVPMEHSTSGAVFRSGTALISQSLIHPIQSYSELGVRPGIVMPLRVNQSVIGVLAVARPKDQEPFDETYLELVRDFADHAALALTLAAARESERELTIVADRDRIAHDLHDNVIQQLFAVGMRLQGTIARADSPVVVADRLNRTIDDLQDIVEDIRATIYRLQRPVEQTGSLRQRIRQVVTELTADSPIATTLHISGPVEVIGTTLANHAEAAIREAVSNAVRHSGATCQHVEVTVSDHILIEIIDDGRGIPADNERRSGLANLVRRAELMGGDCQISTPPGGGTRVRWSAPYGVLDPYP